jgi:hypothetical protein
MSDLSFIGREFLTWLWFVTEKGGPTIQIDGVGAVVVTFTKRLQLSSLGAMREDSTVVSEAPSLADEARTALKTGKKVAKASLMLDLDERHFELTVDATTFAFTGVKLPTMTKDDEAIRLADRLAALDEMEAIIDGLYLRFGQLRKDDKGWYETRVQLHEWITTFTADSVQGAAADGQN